MSHTLAFMARVGMLEMLIVGAVLVGLAIIVLLAIGVIWSKKKG